MGNKNIKPIQRQNTFDFDIVSEDIYTLNTLGFKVKELIGFGDYGSVYRGTYGHILGGLHDFEGDPLDVTIGGQFALKYINIKELEELEPFDTMAEQKLRLFAERTKLKQKMFSNQSLVKIRLCVNLGECQPICLNDRSKPFPIDDTTVHMSYDRLCLFMDFADFGNLDKYLRELNFKGLSVSEEQAIVWLRQLLSAIDYLHGLDAIHANIKPNNVLLFKHTSNDMISAKLSDVGFDYNYSQCLTNDKSSDGNIVSDEESSYSSKSVNDCKTIDQMVDICQMADIFDLIARNTKFESKLSKELTQELIQLMKKLSFKQCSDVFGHQLFESLNQSIVS